MPAEQYQALFSEGKLGGLTLKNRIIMSPTETLYASACGEATPQLIEYYRRRARGGVGMIVLHSIQGNTRVDPYDPYAGSLRLDNNAFIPMLSDLTEAVHEEGARIAALVSIGGGAKSAGDPYLHNMNAGCGPTNVAPSGGQGQGARPSRMLTAEEIRETVQEYGRCAWRARAAGFDAFYIHALGSYLLAEFLSPLFNTRMDRYGGSAENRWRLLFELIDSCRRCAGEDFPLVVRLSLDEMCPEGRSLEESLSFLPRLQQAGVAALDVTAGLMDPMHRSLPPIYVERGANVPYARLARERVSIPVICSGRLYEPDEAEAALREGAADFISIGRGLIADPDWPVKTASGRTEEIRRCLSCNFCIGHRIMQRLPLRCAFNPYAGREWMGREEIAAAPLPRRVCVIGGGPAGLEAARVLGLRGHQVELFEKTDRLCGGQLRAAAAPPCKETLNHLERYYRSQLDPMDNVHIHLNAALGEDTLPLSGFDAYVVASGARPILPHMPGWDGDNICLAQSILLGEREAGSRVVVAGGGQIGAETAHYLAARGRDVTIVELQGEIATQEEPITRAALLSLLAQAGVRMLTGYRVLSLAGGAAQLEKDGETLEVPFDTAVLALGTKSDSRLYDALLKNGKKAVIIGDAAQASNIWAALSGANAAALKL